MLALLMLLGAGIARLGGFRGDGFVASAVVVCGALLALFVALPVLRALSGAFFDEAGNASIAALWPAGVVEPLWPGPVIEGAAGHAIERGRNDGCTGRC